MSNRRLMNDPLDGTPLPRRSHLAAAWVENGPLLFARIVWFTPVVALVAVAVMLIIPVTGFAGLFLLTLLVKTWWVGGVLSLLVIPLARRRDARALRLALSASALSLVLATVGFIVFR